MESTDLRSELKCSICLNFYDRPVALDCGHNFCWGCIVIALNAQEWTEFYFCPDCGKRYAERPTMRSNVKLRKRVALFTTVYKEEVSCSYCDSPTPASKTCLLCETSFCEKHLSYHSKSADHVLTNPITSFGERKCSTHKEALKYYCSDDCSCICTSCWVVGDHKGHQVELLNKVSEKQKKKLRQCINEIELVKEEISRRARNLESHQTRESKKTSAVASSYNNLFVEMLKLNGVEKGVLQEIHRQKKQICQSVSDLNGQLKHKEANLSRRIKQLKELCDIQDPLSVLRMPPTGDQVSPGTEVAANDVKNPVSLNEGMLSQIFKSELCNLTLGLRDLMTKRRFSVMEKSNIFLDINTAHNTLIISKDLKRATHADICVRRPDSLQRFICSQVISTQSFASGRHYWEVDVSEAEEWLIGVASKSMERRIGGSVSYLGYNNKSWSLSRTTSRFQVRHADNATNLDSESLLKIVGIYLEYEAGQLSFYHICDSVEHLHTFTTTFTEPLHAAFHLFPQTSIRIKT